MGTAVGVGMDFSACICGNLVGCLETWWVPGYLVVCLKGLDVYLWSRLHL